MMEIEERDNRQSYELRQNYMNRVKMIPQSVLRYFVYQIGLANPGQDLYWQGFYEGRRATYREILQHSGELERIMNGGTYEALPKISLWRRIIKFIIFWRKD